MDFSQLQVWTTRLHFFWVRIRFLSAAFVRPVDVPGRSSLHLRQTCARLENTDTDNLFRFFKGECEDYVLRKMIRTRREIWQKSIKMLVRELF